MVSWLVAALIVALTVARERRARRRLDTAAGEAAEALAAFESISLELRCGATPLHALAAAAGSSPALTSPAPTAPAFTAPVLIRAAGADTMSGAADVLEAGTPEFRALAAALRLAETAGTSLAALTDALAEPLRDQLRNDRELADALAGVRSSIDLLTGLPLLGILLAAGVGARPLHVLFHTGLGAVCLDLGVGLASLGRFWTGRLIESARLAGRA